MDTSIVDGIIIINLEFRKDKLEKCFEILEEIGMKRDSVHVLNATYVPTNGAKGCSHSHYRAIMHAKSMGWKNVLVLEDDFKFEVSIELFNSRLKEMTSSVQHWDVIMLEWGLNGVNNRSASVPQCPFIRKLTNKKRGAWRTVAYFANASIYEDLIENFFISYKIQKKRKELSVKTYAVDSYWQRLQPFSEWFICTPKLMVCRDFADSDIR
jgi:GR25 family glycosyltransferase involved in LPS biosynthesis